jgi:hypothetical protein
VASGAAGPTAAGGGKDYLRSATPLARMAAAMAHSKQRNIQLSRMLSDEQEADAIQGRQCTAFEITILRPSGKKMRRFMNEEEPAEAGPSQRALQLLIRLP